MPGIATLGNLLVMNSLPKDMPFWQWVILVQKETPNTLDRISLNAIHDAIIEVSKNTKIDAGKIALIGGSKGGELVLNLASYFDDIDAVIAISPSHVSFPAMTMRSNTSLIRPENARHFLW